MFIVAENTGGVSITQTSVWYIVSIVRFYIGSFIFVLYGYTTQYFTHLIDGYKFMCYMAVGTGGPEGGGPAPPPTFQRCKKKFNGEKALEWRKWGVKLEKFSGSLRSPSFIMKQQFKNKYYFAKMFK